MIIIHSVIKLVGILRLFNGYVVNPNDTITRALTSVSMYVHYTDGP